MVCAGVICGLQVEYPSDKYPDEASLPDFEVEPRDGESDESVLNRSLPDPKWHKLSRLGEKGQQGSLLLLAQVFFKKTPSTVVPFVPASIRPKMDPDKW